MNLFLTLLLIGVVCSETLPLIKVSDVHLMDGERLHVLRTQLAVTMECADTGCPITFENGPIPSEDGELEETVDVWMQPTQAEEAVRVYEALQPNQTSPWLPIKELQYLYIVYYVVSGSDTVVNNTLWSVHVGGGGQGDPTYAMWQVGPTVNSNGVSATYKPIDASLRFRQVEAEQDDIHATVSAACRYNGTGNLYTCHLDQPPLHVLSFLSPLQLDGLIVTLADNRTQTQDETVADPPTYAMAPFYSATYTEPHLLERWLYAGSYVVLEGVFAPRDHPFQVACTFAKQADRSQISLQTPFSDCRNATWCSCVIPADWTDVQMGIAVDSAVEIAYVALRATDDAQQDAAIFANAKHDQDAYTWLGQQYTSVATTGGANPSNDEIVLSLPVVIGGSVAIGLLPAVLVCVVCLMMRKRKSGVQYTPISDAYEQ